MTSSINCLLVIIASLSSAMAMATDSITPYQLHYRSEARGISVTGMRELVAENGHYRLSQTANAMLASVSETSRFHLLDGQPQPIEFVYQRKVFGKRLERLNRFADDGSSASFRENRQPEIHIDTPQAVYDPLSFQLAMRLQIQQSGTLQQQQYLIVDEDRVRSQQYRLQEQTEWLETPVGWLKTQRLERIRDNSDKQTIIWLAVDYDYVIVQIEHRKGDTADNILSLTGGKVGGQDIRGMKQAPTATADTP